MMRDITLVGNLTREFEYKALSNDSVVANGSMAVNSRTKDPKTGEWGDGDPHFFNLAVWGEVQAENVIESLDKGTRVIVNGQINMKTVTDDDGNKKTYSEVRVEHIGPELRWATCSVARNAKGNSTSKYNTPEEKF
tara:strand:- start:13748 stop:14155 length:408 start_codon:yes stop_codon:yes gene_type:complete